ncbi:hypothetical protein McpSp1_08320 [Methanocorpusculaceae archaeon Sp1]|uniref:DUF475 domain-containing protein n=1 Tax=Methanorbis furvi TaxID=3028299 RepID=A0AAE4MBH5_9EURY|nr:hypothetical protein [Methanocorpusculaceae archaeon Sp1]MDV0442057.1 hypothetical protein [Methanocorpusculaceae archaeon Ag1]
MEIAYAVLVVLGLVAFETVASIDNAIINADILSTMKAWARRWFLTWGIIIAVFGIRGVLPWLIIWFSTPSLGPIGALTATFSDDATASAAIEQSAPFLLLAGGIFMIFLFLHWLMAEQKNCIVPGERAMSRQGPWFYAVAAIVLFIVCYTAAQINALLAVAAVGGSAIFFIMQGFRLFADKKSAELESGSSNQSDISKLMLLEVIDATFSIDGVIGAFAFTMSVPLILIGNGIGAIIVRELTVRNIDNIRKYAYLKNGAMYSIFTLGLIMCSEGFGIEIPIWIAPILTIGIVSLFFWLSLQRIKKGDFGVCEVPREQ